MADNITINSGSGGPDLKTDDDGTAHWPYTKIVFGADNTQTRVTSSVGLPVELLAGTAAIGKLAANSGVDIGDVDVITAPASVRTTDTISAALASDVLMADTTAKTAKFASLSTASTGNQALVAAVAGAKIRVVSLQVIADASTNAVYINDGTADLYGDATRQIPLDVTGAAGAGGFTLPFNPLGWFETAAVNRPININLGSANGIVAVASYIEV